MRRVLGPLLAASCLLWPARALGASYTWGYDTTRDRVSTAPIGAEAAAVADDQLAGNSPVVVAVPGQSQSTPVVVHGRWYLWTYWDHGLCGTLWTGTVDAATGSASAASPVVLPGEGGPVVYAGPGERLDEPSDASISADGHWVALGVGGRLFWWPAGDPAAGGYGRVQGPDVLAANGTSPTWVADPGTPSGWMVCDGNWDGGLDCFAAQRADGTAPEPLAVYQTTWSAGGRDPAAPITSSAALGSGGQIFFGVASASNARVMELALGSGAWKTLGGAAAVEAPVWSAVATRDGSVFASDVEGTLYRFAASSGVLLARVRSGAGPVIMPPTVTSRVMLLGSPERGAFFWYSWSGAGGSGWLPVPLAAGLSTPTVLTDHGQALDELLYAGRDGSVRLDALATAGAPTLRPLAGWAPSRPAGTAFTAAVADGPLVLLWGDAAIAQWTGQGSGAGRLVGAPGGPWPTAAGGLAVFGLVPRLTAWLVPATVPVRSGQAVLRVLAPTPSRPQAAWVGGGAIPLGPDAGAGPPCPTAWGAAAALGAFPGTLGLGLPAGCGPESGGLQSLEQLLAAAAGRAHPDAAGTPPADWITAGARFQAWTGVVPAGGRPGPAALEVETRTADGRATRLEVWVDLVCPAGQVSGTEGSCAPASTGVVGPAQGCAGAVAFDLTARERSLLCGVLPSWATDRGVLSCYGSWWGWVRSRGEAMAGCAGGG